MPGFDTVLSSEARWDLIDYLRARNAGESMRKTGKWSHPLPIPQFDIACADGRTLDLDDLRGRVLRIIAVSDDEKSAPVPPAGDHDGHSCQETDCWMGAGDLRRERTRDLDCIRDPVRRIERGPGRRADTDRSERMAAGGVAAR